MSAVVFPVAAYRSITPRLDTKAAFGPSLAWTPSSLLQPVRFVVQAFPSCLSFAKNPDIRLTENR